MTHGPISALRLLRAREHVAATRARWRALPPRHRAALALVGLALVLLLARGTLSERLWPDTRAQQLQRDAQQALAEGRLSSPDGRGARQLFEAALALDPDRTDASDGLRRVGLAALARARRDIRAGQHDDARQMLTLATELAVPRAQTAPVADALHRMQTARASVGALEQQARDARRAGRFDESLDALAQWLAAAPGDVRALEAREDTIADLLQRADARLREGALTEAARDIALARRHDDGHADLPDARVALAQRVDATRRAAERDLARGRLERARAGFETLLQVDAQDADARSALARVAVAYAARSEAASADFHLDEARTALENARALAPASAEVARARAHLQRVERRHADAPRATPASARQVTRLLRQAEQAQSRGQLLTPPGESAFDRLAAARALAPRDPRVLHAAARLRPEAQRCYARHLRANRLTRSRECLDAWALLGGRTSELAQARARLAQRWIAVGNERLGAGELDAARGAYAAARALDRDASGLQDFARRLHAASAARQP